MLMRHRTVAGKLDAEGARILHVANEVVRLPHRLPHALARLAEDFPLGLLRLVNGQETEDWGTDAGSQLVRPAALSRRGQPQPRSTR